MGRQQNVSIENFTKIDDQYRINPWVGRLSRKFNLFEDFQTFKTCEQSTNKHRKLKTFHHPKWDCQNIW